MPRDIKKTKISKKTLITGLISVVLLSAPIAYYFSTRENGEVLSWYSSSWDYRKQVQVSNSGSLLSNEDVLVSVDTATLISEGKLQSDCDDLRFVDSDDSTPLDYWIEGGCDSSTTQIWVQIPSLPNGGKTIYMYYDNDSATAGEESWTNYFIALSDQSSCATNWTRISALDDRFPIGKTSYGTPGGTTTHSHSGSCTVNSTSPGSYSAYVGASPYAAKFAITHDHSCSVNTSSENHMPEYVNMLYCGYEKLNIPTNHITMFDVATPTGWTRFTSLDSKFPIGASSSIGGTGGSTTHAHSVSFSVGNYNTVGQGVSTTIPTTSVPTYTHSHTISSQQKSGNNIPPYIDMVFAKKNSSGTLTSERPIYIINNTTLPLGWERFSSLDDKFPRGASSYGGSGGSSTSSHTGGSGTTGGASSYSTRSGGYSVMASHTHSYSYSISGATAMPSYLEVVFAKRKSSQSTSVQSEESRNTAPSSPTDLLTEAATNPTKVTDSTPECSAIYDDPDTTDTSSNYEIEVNTASNFGGTVMWDSGKQSMTSTNEGSRSPDISYNGDALTENTGVTYYWRIKFWDAADAESPWSSTASFTMNDNPNSPTNLLTEGATNPTGVTDSTPEFSAIYDDVDTTDTSSYYEIEVNTTSGFDGTVMWDSNKTAMTTTNENSRSPDISYNGDALTENTGVTYYWRIRFWDANDAQGEWSSTANFTMNDNPNSPTALLTEGSTNPDKVGDITPEFSAIYDDPDTTDTTSYYEIEVNTSSGFDGTIMWDSNKTSMTTTDEGDRSPDITYAGTTLSKSTGVTYYWRIRFWDANNAQGEWSSTANFTMNNTPNSPTNLFTEGSTNPTGVTDSTPEFSAIFDDPDTTDTSSYYEIEVNTTSGFDGTVMWDSGKLSMITTEEGDRSPDISYNGDALTENTGSTYYWRITFWDAADEESPWSSTANFTMNDSPNSPTDLLTEGQTNPQLVVDLTPEFSAIFNDSDTDDTSSYYEIEVNTAMDFTGTVMWDSTKTSMTTTNEGERSPDISYAGSSLSENYVTYYWRIRFWDANDAQGEWSSTANFKTSPPRFWLDGLLMNGIRLD